jgi:hypothetical protein
MHFCWIIACVECSEDIQDQWKASLTMKMLDAELVFVLKLLKLLLRCFLVVLLIFGGGLGPRFEFLANEQDLTVLVVDVLGLDLRPREATELFNDPVDS